MPAMLGGYSVSYSPQADSHSQQSKPRSDKVVEHFHGFSLSTHHRSIRRDLVARVGGLILAKDPPDFQPTETKAQLDKDL
jgi:hypothetical protein